MGRGISIKMGGRSGGGGEGMVKRLTIFQIVGRYFLNTIRGKKFEETQLDAFLPSTLAKKE